jgi:hypothetical protein
MPEKKRPAWRLALWGWAKSILLTLRDDFRVLAHRANTSRTHEFADQATVFHHLDALDIGVKLPPGFPI